MRRNCSVCVHVDMLARSEECHLRAGSYKLQVLLVYAAQHDISRGLLNKIISPIVVKMVDVKKTD